MTRLLLKKYVYLPLCCFLLLPGALSYGAENSELEILHDEILTLLQRHGDNEKFTQLIPATFKKKGLSLKKGTGARQLIADIYQSTFFGKGSWRIRRLANKLAKTELKTLRKLRGEDKKEEVFVATIKIKQVLLSEILLALRAIEKTVAATPSKKDEMRLLLQHQTCWLADPLLRGGDYQGECMSGYTHGYGVAEGINHYAGSFDSGNKHGMGKYTVSDGGYYLGYWVNDRRQGQGAQSYANGDHYIGPWENDKKQGQGVYTWANGSTYEGAYLHGLRHGYGDYNAGAFSYHGQWQQGYKSGQGELSYTNGDSYKGTFFKDKKHGYGTMRYGKNALYKGDWKDGLRQGQGTMVYTNGDRYTGSWLNDQKHGRGIYTWKDGEQHSGKWEHGKRLE